MTSSMGSRAGAEEKEAFHHCRNRSFAPITRQGPCHRSVTVVPRIQGIVSLWCEKEAENEAQGDFSYPSYHSRPNNKHTPAAG